MAKMSDMMEHWKRVKAEYSDCIVFYRLGDFYEMFFDDAIEASRILELTLTGRDCGLEERAPMCGIPYHAVDGYVSKLVASGKKVAICEQLTLPGAQKGLVERGVVRVVTSGTLLEDSQIDEKNNNFVCSVFGDGEGVAISWADITTGEFSVQKIVPYDAEKMMDALVRISPSEIICSSKVYSVSKDLPAVIHGVIPKFSLYKDYAYSYDNAKNALLRHFKTVSIEAFLPEEDKYVVIACGSLLEYLNETQKRNQLNIEKIVIFTDENSLKLDSVALRNLEILRSSRDNRVYGSLLWVIDRTNTSMGARMLKKILSAPLKDAKTINYRLDGVNDLFINNSLRDDVVDVLCGMYDLERLVGKLSNNVATPRDLQAISKTLDLVVAMKMHLYGLKSRALNDILNNLGDYDDICKILNAAIDDNPPVNVKDGRFVRAGFDKRLDEQREISENGTQKIKRMEEDEREKTGIKTLKIRYNKVFGYYIEVSNSFKNQVPYNYVRKQTLVGGERYITEELKHFEEEVLTCSEKIIAIETEIFNKIKQLLIENLSKLLRTAKCISFLDVLVSFATVSKKFGYTRPEICDEDSPLVITGGRHPVVEAVSREQFISNDTLIDLGENRMSVITGPNMAGKSTYMRQVALITILAQCGCFVPAKSAEIPLVDKIFTRVGASDYLVFDQSTFMVEMTEVAKILRNATNHSLLILDEVGRGTSTFDGLSIAWAVVEFIAKKVKAKTLFATHYHELSELEGIVEGVKNYKISVKEFNGSIVFLRKIMRGSANKSFGIEVASLAGVPAEVTARAKTILKKLERNDLSAKIDLESEPQTEKPKSEVESIINDIDINNLTPLQAFEILTDLKEKVKNG